MMTAPDIKAAAQAAAVGYRTLWRWLQNEPNFRAALYQAESATIDEAGRRLLAGQAQALDTLESLMANAKVESDRRLAAVAWMDFVLRWRELRNVEQRLADLESAVYAKHN
jgi:hypothetical protein